MKNLIIIIAALLSFTSASFASNIGDGTLALVKNEKVVVALSNEGQRALIVSSMFNDQESQLSFKFESEVQMITIINEKEEIVMIFPVSSKKVNLGLSLFDQGIYKMGFLIDGENEVQYTSIAIN